MHNKIIYLITFIIAFTFTSCNQENPKFSSPYITGKVAKGTVKKGTVIIYKNDGITPLTKSNAILEDGTYKLIKLDKDYSGKVKVQTIISSYIDEKNNKIIQVDELKLNAFSNIDFTQKGHIVNVTALTQVAYIKLGGNSADLSLISKESIIEENTNIALITGAGQYDVSKEDFNILTNGMLNQKDTNENRYGAVLAAISAQSNISDINLSITNTVKVNNAINNFSVLLINNDLNSIEQAIESNIYEANVSIGDDENSSNFIGSNINTTTNTDTTSKIKKIYTKHQAPVITSVNNFSVNENQTYAFTITATDVNNDILTYSLGGTNENNFSVNSSTGVVSFNFTPDFETNPHIYNIKAIVSDGEVNTTQDVNISLLNLDVQNITVVDGYIKNSIVKDNNNKIASMIDANKGLYSFGEISISYPLTASGGQLYDTNLSYDLNMTTFSGTVISPISTLIQNDTTIKSNLLSILGGAISENDLLGDYIDVNNTNIAKLSQIFYAIYKDNNLRSKFIERIKTNSTNIGLNGLLEKAQYDNYINSKMENRASIKELLLKTKTYSGDAKNIEFDLNETKQDINADNLTVTYEGMLTNDNDGNNDHLGEYVYMYNNYIVSGAFQDDDNGTDSGSVYIFKIEENLTLTQSQKILGSSADNNDYRSFGRSLSIYENYIAIGNSANDDNGSQAGRVYIYENKNGIFQKRQTIHGSNVVTRDKFGIAVKLYKDYLLVSSRKNNTYVYIFKKNQNGDFIEQQNLEIPDNNPGASDIDIDSSLDMTDDMFILGAEFTFINGSNSGSAYVYQKQGDGNFTFTQRLLASNANTDDKFGRIVSINENYIFVSSPMSENNATNSGGVYIYKKNQDGNFTQNQILIANDTNASHFFGSGLANDGDYLLVGANGVKLGADYIGKSYVFKKDSNGIYKQLYSIQGDNIINDAFGSSVDIHNGKIVIGDYFSNNQSGKIYLNSQ